jgi:hypothetical protein
MFIELGSVLQKKADRSGMSKLIRKKGFIQKAEEIIKEEISAKGTVKVLLFEKKVLTIACFSSEDADCVRLKKEAIIPLLKKHTRTEVSDIKCLT